MDCRKMKENKNRKSCKRRLESIMKDDTMSSNKRDVVPKVNPPNKEEASSS